MKLIKAVLQPHAVPAVTEALREIQGIPGVMISEVPCLDQHRGHDQPDINAQLELIVPNALVETVINAIHRAAHTGGHGDGGILVLPVERLVNIRDTPPL